MNLYICLVARPPNVGVRGERTSGEGRRRVSEYVPRLAERIAADHGVFSAAETFQVRVGAIGSCFATEVVPPIAW